MKKESKPLKAIEPVKCGCKTNKDLTECANFDNHVGCLKLHPLPLVDVAENKEERIELLNASLKYGKQQAENARGPITAEKIIASASYDFRKGANWQQSQSIEGIVGFVLEWLENEDYISSKGNGFDKTIDKIKKAYNNGK